MVNTAAGYVALSNETASGNHPFERTNLRGKNIRAIPAGQYVLRQIILKNDEVMKTKGMIILDVFHLAMNAWRITVLEAVE